MRAFLIFNLCFISIILNAQDTIYKRNGDIISAKVIIEHRPAILNVPCFLCQQSVEKYLKAFLISKDQEVMKDTQPEFFIGAMCRT